MNTMSGVAQPSPLALEASCTRFPANRASMIGPLASVKGDIKLSRSPPMDIETVPHRSTCQWARGAVPSTDATLKVALFVVDRDRMQEERRKEVERDEYYMGIAHAVETGADCHGTSVGAVLVLENRVISTGYNGTPAGFTNCRENGCLRCKDSWLYEEKRYEEMSDSEHRSGKALDRCICVHAEQNAMITAARFGIAVEGATLYTTQSPCFGCLKESLQAGIGRVVYHAWYRAKYSEPLKQQYAELLDFLRDGDSTRFEAVGGGPSPIEEKSQPDPYEDTDSDELGVEPPETGAS